MNMFDERNPLEGIAAEDRKVWFSRFVELHNFDHIDFGCSTGGSLKFAKNFFDGRSGLGIDLNADKVEKTRNAGYQAIVYDLHEIPDEQVVRFTLLSHFLEHVPYPSDVFAFVQKACCVSSDFVFIQQPYFDADGYLARNGLKIYWSDWSGHPNRMTSLELFLILKKIQNGSHPITFSILVRDPIVSSEDRRIHSLDSPINQRDFDADVHPNKGAELLFTEPVFSETLCLITMPEIDHQTMLKKIIHKRRAHVVLYSEKGAPILSSTD